MFLGVVALLVVISSVVVDLKYSKDITPTVSFVVVLLGAVIYDDLLVIGGALLFVVQRFLVLFASVTRTYRNPMMFVDLVKEPLLVLLLVIMASFISMKMVLPAMDEWSSSVVVMAMTALTLVNIIDAKAERMSFIADFISLDIDSLVDRLELVSGVLMLIMSVVSLVYWGVMGLPVLLGYAVSVVIADRVFDKTGSVFLESVSKLIPVFIVLIIRAYTILV
ncbi:MAG: hypothetical protein QXP03_06280 [Desulfurococcaceae archaeon]